MGEEGSEGARGAIRILTANLESGGADPAALEALLRRHAPDVACLKELGPAQAEAVTSVLPHGRLEPALDHCGMGIALHRDVEVGRIAMPYRAARVVRLEPGEWPTLEDTVEIVNLHVMAPTKFPYWEQPATRSAQVQGLLAHVRASDVERRVLVGDLNATPVWPVYREIARHFEDAAHSHARLEGRRPARTWPAWSWLREYRLLRIDHCFTQAVQISRVERLSVPGSDHDALCIDVAADPTGLG